MPERYEERETWFLARKLKTTMQGEDSRATLEAFGFRIVEEADYLFYLVVPPTDWTKDKQGRLTAIFDASGTLRVVQYHQNAVNMQFEAFLLIN